MPTSTRVTDSNLFSIAGDQYITTNLTNVVDSSLGAGREHREIAEWLSSLNFKASQLEFLQRKQDGTGEWLLESPLLKDWRDGILEMLWCPGIREIASNNAGPFTLTDSERRVAGSGKTILTSIVVEHLQAFFKDDDRVAITCIYLNYKEQKEQTVSNLIASVLKQMVQDHPTTSANVKAVYEHHRNRKTRPILRELMEVLKLETEAYSKVFIVVDALDECEHFETRAHLLKTLRSLFTAGTVRLMVTSRDLPLIAQEFHSIKRLDIRASNRDIGRYLEGRIALAPLYIKRLREHIVKRVVQNADGMFLLARLHMDSLLNKLNTRAVRKALEELPHGVNQAYDEAMARIEGQDKPRIELAEQVLSWITYAFRPLAVEELQHALAVQPGMNALDPETIIDKETLTSVCAGLVVVDETRRIMRLVHYTTQEYFTHIRESRFPRAQASIAVSCLTYLSLDTFRNFYRAERVECWSLRYKHKFLHYAANYWGHHARGPAEESIKETALAFLQDSPRVAFTCQFLSIGFNYPYLHHRVEFSGVQLTAFFGLGKILCCQMQHRAKMDVRHWEDWTPLCIAAERGHESVMKLLLAQDDVDLNSKNRKDRIPLSWAVIRGRDVVVKLLLAHDNVDMNSKDTQGDTPLSHASSFQSEGLVKLLVTQDKIDINLQNNSGRTPLSRAAIGGREAVVKLLLTRDEIDINLKDGDGRTPLSYAASGGHVAVVKLLLTRDEIDINLKDGDGRTPLSHAALCGYEAVVKLLFTRDEIDICSKDDHGRTLLSRAASCGKEAVVKLLLTRDEIDINLKDGDGMTPLSCAASVGRAAVVKLLLTRDEIDINTQDVFGRMPLSLAVSRGHMAVVKLLLTRDEIEMNLKDRWGRTPLSNASCGNEACVKLLLTRDEIDVNSMDMVGRTPLSHAALGGHDAVVKLLLTRDEIDINTQDGSGRTPLLLAASWGREAVVQMLLTRDEIDINLKDNHSDTPLSNAAMGGHKAVVKLLLAHEDTKRDVLKGLKDNIQQNKSIR